MEPFSYKLGNTPHDTLKFWQEVKKITQILTKGPINFILQAASDAGL